MKLILVTDDDKHIYLAVNLSERLNTKKIMEALRLAMKDPEKQPGSWPMVWLTRQLVVDVLASGEDVSSTEAQVNSLTDAQVNAIAEDMLQSDRVWDWFGDSLEAALGEIKFDDLAIACKAAEGKT